MEDRNIRDELVNILKEFYLTHYKDETNKEKKEKFIEDLDCKWILEESPENQENVFVDKIGRFTAEVSGVVEKLLSLPKLGQKSKFIEFNIDKKQNEEKYYKTKFELNYHFNSKCKKTHLNDTFQQDLGLNTDDCFFILSINVTDPEKAKQICEDIIEQAKAMLTGINIFIDAFVDVTHEYQISNDRILITFKSNSYMTILMTKIFTFVSHKFSDRSLEATLNISSYNNFENLDYTNQDIVKVFSYGTQSFSLKTDIMHFLTNLLLRRDKDKVPFNYLTLLECSMKFNLSMDEYDESMILGPKLRPRVNLFDSDNRKIRNIVKDIQQYKYELPLVERIFDLFEILTGSVIVNFNSPLGMISGQIQTNGLLTVWDILKTMHFVVNEKDKDNDCPTHEEIEKEEIKEYEPEVYNPERPPGCS